MALASAGVRSSQRDDVVPVGIRTEGPYGVVGAVHQIGCSEQPAEVRQVVVNLTGHEELVLDQEIFGDLTPISGNSIASGVGAAGLLDRKRQP